MIKLKFFENREGVREIDFPSCKDAIEYIKHHNGTKKILVKLVDRLTNFTRDKKCFLDSDKAIAFLEEKNVEINSRWWRVR